MLVNATAFLTVLDTLEVRAIRADMSEQIGAVGADSVWSRLPDVGEGDMAGLMTCWILKLAPVSNLQLCPILESWEVGDSRLTVIIADKDEASLVLCTPGPELKFLPVLVVLGECVKLGFYDHRGGVRVYVIKTVVGCGDRGPGHGGGDDRGVRD